MKLGTYLRAEGFSVREFAKSVNVTEAAMSRYVSGKRLPRLEIMQRIVEASGGGVQPNDFFERDTPPTPVEIRPAPAVTKALDTADETARFLACHPDVRWVDTLIPDLNGIPRGKRLDVSGLAKAFKTGLRLPGSTYAMNVMGENVDSTGMGPPDGDPDYPCYAVPGTLAPVPWVGPEQAQVLLTMVNDAEAPWWLDPRVVVRRMADRIAELGLKPVVAIELEFYLIEPETGEFGVPRLAAAPGTGLRPRETQVFLMDDLDAFAPVLNDIIDMCRAQHLPADVATIEYAPGQFEINLKHVDDPVAACDHAFLMKRAIKGVARRHGMVATFMARPFRKLSTSGTHIHLSLLDKDGRNIFDDGGLAGTAKLRHAVGGLTATMAEGMAIWAPNANSFRRINPHGWVPLAPTWGYNNRTVAIRIPSGETVARRLEHRAAGADANPYLVMAGVLAGVHHGLVNAIDPGPAITGNAPAQVPASLPAIWVDALRAFDEAKVLPDYLGTDYCDMYSKIRWSEFLEFNDHISALEYDRFLRMI
jgi:glutamine synthetase